MSSRGKKLLAKADQVLDEKGWCSGSLVDDQGRHCALGAIGYARWGDEFDTAATNANPYGKLYNDAACQDAIDLLHRELRSNKRLNFDSTTFDLYERHGDLVGGSRKANIQGGDIVAFNDDSKTRARVAHAFRKAGGRIKEAAKKVMRQPPVKVEYIPATPEAVKADVRQTA